MNFGSLVNFAGQMASNYDGSKKESNKSNNNDDNNNNNGQNTGGIDALLSLIPQEQQKTQKDKIFDTIGPVIKVMSPKWGDVIVGILKNMEFSKLLPIAKDEKELEKAVREEEKKLEANESNGQSIEEREAALQKELIALKEAKLQKELDELRAQKNS